MSILLNGVGNLGESIQSIVNAFKSRVAADSGTFEAESCLITSVINFSNINLA